MRTVNLVLAASMLFSACAPAEKYTYDKKTDEMVRVGKRQVLKAGRRQTISMTFHGQMSEVYGALNGQRIPFKCENPNEYRQVWTAEFDVPKLKDLGPEKDFRVYAKDLGGEDIIGGNLERFPAAWARRGNDGKFPQIPAERFERFEIRE